MAQIVYLPKPIPLSTAGGLLAGAKLYTYLTGTNTPQAVYQDYGLSVEHTNPVEADINGVFPVMYWGNTNRYRLDLQTSAGVSLSGYPVDDCGPETSTGLGAPSLSGNNTLTGSWNKFQSTDARIILDDTDGGTNKRLVDLDHNGGVTTLRTRTDADGSGKAILTATQGTGTAISTIAYGNSSDNPTHTFYGSMTGDSAGSSSISKVRTGTAAYKATSTSRSSTTTLADDPDLVIALSASSVYVVEICLAFYEDSAGSAGIKLEIPYTGSGGSVGGTWIYNGNVNGSDTTGELYFNAPTTIANVGSIASRIVAQGLFDTTTAGNLKVRWAQNSSSANATTVVYASYLKATRIA